MNKSPESITVWFEQLRRGNPEAAEQLWSRLFDRLVAFSRSEMSGANRRVADEDDIAAGVMTALCISADRGKLPAIENRESLWRLLLSWTRHDIADHVRRERRIKRGGGTVRGDSAIAYGNDEPPFSMPSGELLVEMQEQFEALLAKLPDPTLQTIAVRRMESYSSDEIADQLGVSNRTVQRKLELIRQYWETEV